MPLLLLASCQEPPVINETLPQGDSYKESLINANKVINSAEQTQIEAYAQRRQWQMRQLDNGSYYEETLAGKGRKVDYDDTVSLRYSVDALNGKRLYTDVATTVVVGQHKPTVGVDRALMEMRRGGKARLILPSSLAYGVVGDGDQVPGRTVLVFAIEIID